MTSTATVREEPSRDQCWALDGSMFAVLTSFSLHRAFDQVDDYDKLSMCDRPSGYSAVTSPDHARLAASAGSGSKKRKRRTSIGSGSTCYEPTDGDDSFVTSLGSNSLRNPELIFNPWYPDFTYVEDPPVTSPESCDDDDLVSDFRYAGPRDNIQIVSDPGEDVLYEINWRVVPVYSVYPPFPQLAMTSLTTRVRLSEAESHRLVNRLKNTNLDKFHVICKMHLCFLLHLPGSSLEEFLNDNRTTTCSGQHQTHHTPATDKHKFRYFGRKKSSKDSRSNDHQPITQLTIDQIQPLIDYLDSESNIKQEGLFRKSGHLGRQKLLRDKLQNGADIREELDTAVYTAHDCASVLKAFLSELPEPILTERHYKAHCQIPEMKLESKQLQTLQLLLQLLPAKNFHLLRCLLTLLHKVALEPANKMTSDNLGTLFAPHLLMPRRMSPSELQMAAADMSKMVTFMIDNVHELFKLPQPVIRDIATYWTQMEESMMRSSVDDGDGMARPYHGQLDTSDPPVYTSVTFADRHASQQAATQTDTQMALAELYAHVSAMPSSSKKRRLLKQFNKASITTNTSSPVVNSDRSKRTRLFGDSIKKIVGRSHRRHLSHQGYLIQQGIHDIHTTPVTRATNTHRTTPAGHITKLPSNNQVHIVDMKENHDPKACLKPMRRQDSPTRTCVLLAQTAYTPSCMTPELSMTLTNSHRTEVTPMEVPSRSRFHGKQARSPVRGTPDCRFERPTAFLSPITRTFNKACLTVKANVMTPRSRAPVAVIRTP